MDRTGRGRRCGFWGADRHPGLTVVEFHEQVQGGSCLVGYAVLETGLDSVVESNWGEV
jgi:hypothetical protein